MVLEFSLEPGGERTIELDALSVNESVRTAPAILPFFQVDGMLWIRSLTYFAQAPVLLLKDRL